MRSIKKPLCFVDLDDTLFQTARKMPSDTQRWEASFTAEGKPSGFMSVAQYHFAHWLFQHADVVPVTARSVEVLDRVRLPFSGPAVCSHGAVILGADKSFDEDWHRYMTDQLAPFQSRLPEISELTLSIGSELQMSLRGWVVTERDMHAYVVTKHNGMDDQVLTRINAVMEQKGLLDGMYTHQNANNLAYLPQAVNKRVAVQELIRRDQEMNGERPILGFGDSLTDLGFMDLCHWWGTPSSSQIAGLVKEVAQ